ncbi:MAG: desulfoferrodoxin family protein [Lachnospirales bacterium]
MDFYICERCGNILNFFASSDKPVTCCNLPLSLLATNTTDLGHEKHVPIISKNGNTICVEVGIEAHPMMCEHWIQQIVLVTKKTRMIATLNYDDVPKVYFNLNDGDDAVTAYSYCNIHGLWNTY